MSLTGAAIAKSRVTAAALLVLLFAGIDAYRSLPRNEDPGFIIRTAVITTVFPGASPERVEQLVTDKIEKVVQEIPELDFVNSQSKTGVSIVFVNFLEEYTEMRPIFDDLRRKVDKARDELPAGVIGPHVDDEFGDVFGVIVGVTGGDEFSYVELEEIAEEVRDELLLIEEVAKVEIHGAQEERIFLEFNNARLAELGLSPSQLRQILAAQNIIIPGGEVRTEFEQAVLEPSGNFGEVEQIGSVVLRLPGSEDVVYLRDVVDIERGYIDPPARRVRIDGKPGLALAISMRDGGNIDILGRAVRETMERVTGFYPIGVDFSYIQFQPDVVEQKIDDFAGNLVQAVVIVTLVMLAFLGLRTGLVVASLIPMAMVSSFFVMRIFGIGLDQMSIASLIIALGMLVDNAIVMSESIMVQVAEGKSKVDAAIDSAAELRIPLLTSSLTTAAAFLPIFLAESSTGEYTAPLFKVVSITLLCSWLLSLTMIPLSCVLFLRIEPSAAGASFGSTFYRNYRGALLFVLRHRALALGVAAGALLASVAMLRFVPQVFFPPSDRTTFTVEIELPAGTPLARTQRVVADVERYMLDNHMADDEAGRAGIVNWGSFMGEGAPRFVLSYSPNPSAPEYAILLVNATDRGVVDELVEAIDRYCLVSFPDVLATVRPLSNGPPSWPPVEVRLSGRDSERLFRQVERVKQRVSEEPGARLLGDDWGARAKKIVIRIDQPRALRAGVTSEDVAISLQTFFSGIEVTEYRERDELIPIVLRSVAVEREDIDKLETLNVYAQASGLSVPLAQVADIELQWEPSVILRRDRLRTVTVEAAFEPGFTAAAVTDGIRPWLVAESAGWGLGDSWEFGGEAETSADANASIVAKLPVAGLIIVLLLVGQFNSFRRPAIILLTIPLSLIGVVFGLLVARSYFGFMTLLGIVSLAGIVINNAIVLLDRIRIEIEENGLDPARAVIESAQRRLRPILLTTCTTIGGLIPLWLGGGPMWEPMAISIIFGLMFATALTLGVVPILYSFFFRVRFDDFRYRSTGNAD